MNLFENLMLYKEAKNNKNNYVYHGTKSKEAANNIINNGFNTFRVFLIDNEYDAKGYGQHIIKLNKEDVEQKLKIKIKDYNDIKNGELPEENLDSNFDGVKFRYSPNHSWNYLILNVDKLNKLNMIN